MKKLFYFFGLAAVSSLVIVACNKNQNLTLRSQSNPSFKSSKSNSAGSGYTIQSGKIFYSAGSYLTGPIKTGYDSYGYNYQAHMFKGWYVNAYLNHYGFPPYYGDPVTYAANNPNVVGTWMWPPTNTKLVMKWNDAWLSNKDRDGDGLLDRHYGFDSYIGSGAWETNHMWGTYTNDKGKICHWDEFTKIIAVPVGATLTDGIWYNTNGKEIGPSIWGQFAIIQDVYNDPNGGFHGIDIHSLDHSGFGGW